MSIIQLHVPLHTTGALAGKQTVTIHCDQKRKRSKGRVKDTVEESDCSPITKRSEYIVFSFIIFISMCTRKAVHKEVRVSSCQLP